MYYPDDFFDELSEFDTMVDDLKAHLAISVKNEFIERMKRLEDENLKPQGIKDHFDQVRRDYEAKKQECDRAIRNAESKAKQARLYELMQQNKILLWSVQREYLYGPKCSKCDRNRQVKITLPSGRKTDDLCLCAREQKVLVRPKMNILYEFSDRYGMNAWYSASGSEGEEYFVLEYADTTHSHKNVVKPGTPYEAIEKKDQNNLLFGSSEECQAYCDWLNKKAGITDSPLYYRSGDMYRSPKTGE